MPEVLKRHAVENILPISGQTEIERFLPTTLQGLIFDDTTADGARLNVYAILDAARAPMLTGRLEASGLEHACLFNTKNQADLADVAPWLLRLESRANQTRQLFSDHRDGSDPWDLLRRMPGVILRPRHDMRTVKAGMRRLTQVFDEDGVRFYFRFYEPGPLETALHSVTVPEVAGVFTVPCWELIRRDRRQDLNGQDLQERTSNIQA